MKLRFLPQLAAEFLRICVGRRNQSKKGARVRFFLLTWASKEIVETGRRGGLDCVLYGFRFLHAPKHMYLTSLNSIVFSTVIWTQILTY